MASGLPIVASDLPVHREICGEALFFPRFSPDELANRVLELANDRTLANELATAGLERSRAFSWDRHVEQLLRLGRRLRTV
jgi:glycosyltransferase involved in cell wall biosynthesis